MKKLFIVIYFLLTFLMTTTVIYAGTCEDLGACTLSSGTCGANCNGICMSFEEAKCCMSGMCYRNGSWCGGVECNGTCMSPEEARCCMSGCNYVNGACDCRR